MTRRRSCVGTAGLPVVALPGAVQSEARALEQAIHLLAARI